MTGFWYLATPYSGYPDGIEAAFALACRETALLIRAGVPVFSPIAHSHSVAIHGGIDPRDHSIWIPADQPFMNAARGLIVLMAEGWTESAGVRAEIAIFRAAAKPTFYMAPGIVPAGLGVAA